MIFDYNDMVSGQINNLYDHIIPTKNIFMIYINFVSINKLSQ